MALRVGRKKPRLGSANPTRFQIMTSDDLYLMLEATLMGAQEQLADFRKAPVVDRAAKLAWLRSSLAQASTAAEEFATRI